jgi:hypothetical protein
MAKLLQKSLKIDIPIGDPEWLAKEKAALDTAKAQAKAKYPNDELAGETVRFQVADGYAVYMVIKSKPLTLQHVEICDGYFIPYAHVRGLRLADIKKDVAWQRKWEQKADAS